MKISDNGPTVRQRIIQALHEKLVAATDGGSLVFRAVLRGDLESVDNTSLPVVAIDCGTEDMEPGIAPASTYFLPTFFHFRFRGQRGVDELDLYQYYLGIVQLAVLSDNQLGGLTLDVWEQSNAHTIVGIEDVYPGGTLSTVVKYRTRLHNPYKLLSER